MPQRLSDQFQINDRVEIYLSLPALASLPDEASWQPGTVVGVQHPGLWVATAGTFWFVTNGRHIRPAPTTAAARQSQPPRSV
jgi:hypothetical protein